MTLQQGSYLANIILALVGLPGGLWTAFRVCQIMKLIRRQHQGEALRNE